MENYLALFDNGEGSKEPKQRRKKRQNYIQAPNLIKIDCIKSQFEANEPTCKNENDSSKPRQSRIGKLEGVIVI